MKKIFTTLLAGTMLVTTSNEVKANSALENLQGEMECEESNYESNMLEISQGINRFDTAPAVTLCQQYQNDAIEINATDIDTNTTNITTNASDIDTNASAIETLQGSSSSADITANTNKINTNTSNINSLGEGVAGSTALTAALSALPQMSKESKSTCGVGTGAYSSRYAVGFGCASKVSKRIDVNAGGSYVFGGSKSYGGGTLDSGVVKAGFVFKLGELNKPTQISLNESNVLKNEVKDLKAKNNQLLSRLEKLENIASKFLSSSEMISVATKD